jgi:hypothetical protein
VFSQELQAEHTFGQLGGPSAGMRIRFSPRLRQTNAIDAPRRSGTVEEAISWASRISDDLGLSN